MQEVRDEGAIRATTLPPGWDEAVDLEADPATIPDPAEVEVPDALRAEIERLMRLYPDRHSATLPALGAAQRVHGWCSPEALRQVAAVMQVTPAYLSGVATFYDMLRTEPAGSRYVYVCTSVACHLRNARRVYKALGGRGGVPGARRRGPARVRVPRRLRHGADGVRRRPLRRPAHARRRARAGSPAEGEARRCCPAAASGTRASACPTTRRPRASPCTRRWSRRERDARPAREHRRARPPHDGGLRAPRRLPARCARRCSRWTPRPCCTSSRSRGCAAAAAPASRWARRRASSRRARWTSTSAATPTSPSRAPSRTAC